MVGEMSIGLSVDESDERMKRKLPKGEQGGKKKRGREGGKKRKKVRRREEEEGAGFLNQERGEEVKVIVTNPNYRGS